MFAAALGPRTRCPRPPTVFYPRIGYAFAFNETIGLWPRAGIVYTQDQLSTNNVSSSTGSSVERTATIHFINVGLEAMLFISPMKHFAILIGPYGEIGLDGGTKVESSAPGSSTQKEDAKMNSFGLSVGIVGYY